jgi:hypothetical protein
MMNGLVGLVSSFKVAYVSWRKTTGTGREEAILLSGRREKRFIEGQ